MRLPEPFFRGASPVGASGQAALPQLPTMHMGTWLCLGRSLDTVWHLLRVIYLFHTSEQVKILGFVGAVWSVRHSLVTDCG